MSKKALQISFFVVFTAIVLTILFFIFKPYFGVLFVSGIFAVAFYPLYEKLVEKFKGKKGLASFITTFLVLVFIIIPIIVLSAALLREAIGLYNSFSLGGGPQDLISRLNAAVNDINSLLPLGSESQVNVEAYARNVLNWIIGNFDSIFITIFGSILNLILMLLSLFYFFVYGNKIKNTLVSWSPLPDRYDEEFIKTLKISMDAVLRGRILVSIAQGIFIGIGFAIFGVGSPVLWGFVGAIASLIPVLGTSILIVPASVFLYLSGNTGSAVGLFIWGALIVGLVDNLISAMFLKNRIKVHPLVVLFSILGGVEVFGAIGFLAGPLIVSVFMALMKIYPFIVFRREEST